MYFIERAIEALDAFVQHALQAAYIDDGAGIARRAEAFGGNVAALGEPDHACDVDLAGGAGELEAAALAADVAQHAFAPEEMHDLREVVLRDAECLRDLGDRRAPQRRGGEVDQHPQAVIGEGREAHGYAAPKT